MNCEMRGKEETGKDLPSLLWFPCCAPFAQLERLDLCCLIVTLLMVLFHSLLILNLLQVAAIEVHSAQLKKHRMLILPPHSPPPRHPFHVPNQDLQPLPSPRQLSTFFLFVQHSHFSCTFLLGIVNPNFGFIGSHQIAKSDRRMV